MITAGEAADSNWWKSLRSEEVGSSLGDGRPHYSFFGQFQDESNVYVSARYGF